MLKYWSLSLDFVSDLALLFVSHDSQEACVLGWQLSGWWGGVGAVEVVSGRYVCVCVGGGGGYT